MNKKLNRRLKTTFIGCGQCGCQIVSERKGSWDLMEQRIIPLSLVSTAVWKIYPQSTYPIRYI